MKEGWKDEKRKEGCKQERIEGKVILAMLPVYFIL